MVIFLLLSLAYWWLENLAHELLGTALFALVAWHIAMNRFWFKNLLLGRYDKRRAVTLLLHLLLIGNMLVLLVTSIVISKSVFSFLPIPDSIYLRDVHWFAAYWVMIIVGVHLGLHWARVMAMLRSSLGVSQQNTIRTLMLRIIALLIAGFGAWSFSVLGVWTKLTFNYSLDFWDFTASVTPFFGHWLGVTALPAVITYYLMASLRSRRHVAPRARQQSQNIEGEAMEEGTGA
jgi:hypothetical protein